MSFKTDINARIRRLENQITRKSIEVRGLQIDYFKSRSTGLLNMSKTAERELDALHREYKTAERQRDGLEAVPGRLFD